MLYKHIFTYIEIRVVLLVYIEMTEMKTFSLDGGCQCGQIRYHIDGQYVRSAVVCHCRMCQKAMGNAFGIFAPFRFQDVSWTKGTPSKFQSSSIAHRLFCSNCGTPLAYQPLNQSIVSITAGSLDNPTEFPPMEQIGTENRIVWADSLSNLPAKTTDEQFGKLNLNSYQYPYYQ